MIDFVNLHVHTEFSLLDGACRIRGLVSRVKELGQSAVAITDHGVMFGCIDFYNECKANDVKPIIGCEVYVAPRTRHDKLTKLDSSPYHLILLCENNTGYHNLAKLVSDAFTEGFYSKPRCDLETLRQYHEGLICMSACLSGEIPRLLMAGDYNAALKTALLYRDIFGAGNYYIEVQNHGIPAQERILPQLYRLSRETGIPLCATNDAHYLVKEDAEVQHVLTCIATNTTIDDKSGFEFPTQEFYIKSGDEMAQLFPAEAVENTVRIAERCNVEFEFGVTKLPYFHIEGCDNNTEYFKKAVYDGLKERYGDNPSEEIKQRVEYELDVITRMGYVDYFLIVADFINFARSVDIPVGPGRGSGVGSICAYCLKITSVDPLRFNLLFERFLNPERVSMPDFDIDFCYRRRQEVIDYVARKYGRDHVAQIITFGTLAARAAIRDVGRAMGMPYAKVDDVAKKIPFSLHSSISRAIKEEPALAEMVNSDKQIKQLIETSLKIEGMPRHASVHAAGIVITREPVAEYVPLQQTDSGVVTQYTMTTLERLGLLKMDFLGLRYLTVIDDCCKAIKQRTPSFDINAVNETDNDVFAMLAAGETSGVFQFESDGMTNVLMRLRPTSIEDLTATISLYRPGPMQSIPRYIENRHHPESISYKHPLLREILEVTYGCIVYQEQVMQICRLLGGYSYGRADLVRRAMAKKKLDVMEKERSAFIYGTDTNCGAVANGVPETVANEIFDDMAGFATYAFNKSHAAAYAYLAFQTAYLRCHYYRDYMIAMMTSVLDQTYSLIGYITDLKKHGVKLLPPSVNSSFLSFTNEESGVRFGLLAIKNLGRNVINSIITQREKGAYTSLTDFCTRIESRDLNKRAVEALIKSGALDCLGHNRRQMFMAYEQIMDSIAAERNRNIDGQLDLFGETDSAAGEFKMPDAEEYRDFQLLQMEKESIGIYVSGHPIDRYSRYIDYYGLPSVMDIIRGAAEGKHSEGASVQLIGMLIAKKQYTSKSNKIMCFATFEDITGSIEGVIFSSVYEKVLSQFRENDIFAIYGTVSVKEEEDAKILVNRIEKASELKIPQCSSLFINLRSDNITLLGKVSELLSKHTGTDSVRICFSDTHEVKALKGIVGVNITKELLSSLSNLCGKSNIITK